MLKNNKKCNDAVSFVQSSPHYSFPDPSNNFLSPEGKLPEINRGNSLQKNNQAYQYQSNAIKNPLSLSKNLSRDLIQASLGYNGRCSYQMEPNILYQSRVEANPRKKESEWNGFLPPLTKFPKFGKIY